MEIKSFLKPYIAVADMIANTFGEDCEVVVHDLEYPEHSVVYVANNKVTGREIGQSFYTLVNKVMLSEELKDDHADNYYFTAANGKLIRSSTLMIRDEGGEVAGAICINLDTSRITQQMEYLRHGRRSYTAYSRQQPCRDYEQRSENREGQVHGRKRNLPYERQCGKSC